MRGRYPIAVLIAMLIGAGHFAEAEAVSLSGGSRLIFYYTSRSVADPAAGPGSATTIVSITNHSATTAARVIAWVRRADCTSFGFFERVIGPNQTWRLVPADLAPPGEAGEGWVSFYTVGGIVRPGTGTTGGCMLSRTLADLVADIATAFPTTGSVEGGGNLSVTAGVLGNKGFVGLLFEYAQSAPVLAVSPIEHALTQGDAVHE